MTLRGLQARNCGAVRSDVMFQVLFNETVAGRDHKRREVDDLTMSWAIQR
jgi:hypothetical protein